MPQQNITLNFTVNWVRLKGPGRPYQWGDTKSVNVDPNWRKANVIYRWIKNSTGKIAVIGETNRSLSQRVNNYTSANPHSGAGQTNIKVYLEQQKLLQNNDFLYLEFTDLVRGYDLKNRTERRFAESLLIGYSRPYLQ